MGANREVRGIQRYPIVGHRDCSLGIIAFKRLEWTDLVARIVDMSVIGIGIEASQQVEPGLVWFKECVGGHKSGVLLWSKPDGPRYRAGIKFVSLSRDEEAYLQEQVKQSLPREPIRDPKRILSMIIESYKKERSDHR
ncbi:MAG TPA: PilZ domain-containing protein [Nitrospirota bacterium]